MRALRTSSALIAAVITFAACGGDSVSTGEVGPPSQPAAPADVPSVDVSRIPSGEAVNLQTLAQGNDTLFWFWAPH